MSSRSVCLHDCDVQLDRKEHMAFFQFGCLDLSHRCNCMAGFRIIFTTPAQLRQTYIHRVPVGVSKHPETSSLDLHDGVNVPNEISIQKGLLFDRGVSYLTSGQADQLAKLLQHDHMSCFHQMKGWIVGNGDVRQSIRLHKDVVPSI